MPLKSSTELIAGAGVICFWLWSVRGARLLQGLRMIDLLPLERSRRRAAVSGYFFAFVCCVLLAMTREEKVLRLLAALAVLSPFLQAWMDPERSGFLHHKRLRVIAVCGHIVFSVALAYLTDVPAVTPLAMAALVFHRHHRETLRRYGDSLREQDLLRAKLQELLVSTQLLASINRVHPGSDLPDDKVHKAG